VSEINSNTLKFLKHILEEINNDETPELYLYEIDVKINSTSEVIGTFNVTESDLDKLEDVLGDVISVTIFDENEDSNLKPDSFGFIQSIVNNKI
jgi:hypothetical protein